MSLSALMQQPWKRQWNNKRQLSSLLSCQWQKRTKMIRRWRASLWRWLTLEKFSKSNFSRIPRRKVTRSKVIRKISSTQSSSSGTLFTNSSSMWHARPILKTAKSSGLATLINWSTRFSAIPNTIWAGHTRESWRPSPRWRALNLPVNLRAIVTSSVGVSSASRSIQ